MTTLETERLILRPWQEDDAGDLYMYASNPVIGLAAGWPPHTSVEHSREIIRTIFSAPETYAVVLKETGQPIGCCGIVPPDYRHSDRMGQNDVEIGYWLGQPHWGNGYIPEAVDALLDRCFRQLGHDAAWIGFFDGNDRSRRVAEKCGFKYHHTEQSETDELFYRINRQEHDVVD